MFGYPGEGLTKCHSCGAMVPSVRSIIDLPGAPEDDQLCFRPVSDATMHDPGCAYCHGPEQMEYLKRLMEAFDRQEWQEARERNKLAVGELFDSINDHLVAKTPDLVRVAEIGKCLLVEAICTADEQDNAEFFVHAYELAGPVIDALLEECGRDRRDSSTGRRMQRANDER
jgi:hypothetical protein